MEVINLDPLHIKLAVTIQNAIDRAKTQKEMCFIRVYPDGDNVHIGEINGDAALEIQEWINKRKKHK